MALFDLTKWPTVFIFLLAGLVAACFAFVTANLFTEAMANTDFIRKFGLEAIRHGALIQIFELAAWGAMALLLWLVFKICEQILRDRYMIWTSRRGVATEKSSSGDPT